MKCVGPEIKKSIELLTSNFYGRPKFLLAVSGGPDSQCLLLAFSHVARKLGLSCVAVGVNHGLRPEADAELELAKDLASKVGVPYKRVGIKVAKGGNLMARARDARYKALLAEADAQECDYVVTAHHFDDRAETVMIRLIRGENLGSLGVLPMLNGRVFRPMLQVTRADIERHLKRWGVSFATDPSNSNTHYLRIKIRKEIMPMFEALNPKFKARLNAIADEVWATPDKLHSSH